MKRVTDELFVDTASETLASFPLVTAADLAREDKMPTQVRMLARDFIDNSLYNPHYGYFSKRAVILSTGDSTSGGFDFANIKDALRFDGAIAQRYADHGEDPRTGPGRQIWHTPTELFKPYYGQAMAQCLVSEYLLKYFPYEDFILYEVGAGNGTLAANILDFLQERHPEVYERTRYRIIEISGALAKKQQEALRHHSCVEVINKSVFEWTEREWAPCFFIALEVIDNFAHDVVRYHNESNEPYQTSIAVDAGGDYHELFQAVHDPLISAYLRTRATTTYPRPFSSLWHRFKANVPFAPNLSPPHFVPTRMYDLLTRLRAYFPRHRLLLSDFSSLPEGIRGHDAPVVQTRFQGQMIPVTTYLVSPGFFDIFFPTDFELLRDIYERIMVSSPAGAEAQDQPYGRWSPLAHTSTSMELGSQYFFFRGRRAPVDGVFSASGLPVGQRFSSVFTHKEFLSTYADLDKTRLRSGENPMLDLYQNVKFLF
ncbi:DUF185-domain-containing protein [Exidia glandulosa HHB12029]|uniref:Protein arginine methyltransferase NDUFAF7 n=1 Tax=Exidia glandulosa HHB12029 TaxID=1314781 RepID=A0A165IAF1_EXIGL|nr:DUF185-domain-containing protein [Exidia glandulosa HHB12029]